MFPTDPGEDDATNPGIFGRSLALWVGKQLVPGFCADAIVAEDFGWLVPVPSPDSALYVACSSSDGTSGEWQLFVFAERGLLSRVLRGSAPPEPVNALFERIREMISRETGITDLRQED